MNKFNMRRREGIFDVEVTLSTVLRLNGTGVRTVEYCDPVKGY